MLRLLWSENATRDVRGILNFISDDSPNAARKLRARIEEAILPVLHFPYLHREGRVPGTREIVVHPNYIVVYAVRAEHIEIVSVIHTRQEYP